MKSVFFFLALLGSTTLTAQSRVIYGLFNKSDGSRIKGAIKLKGFEDQIEITNYTGGSDNTATIEIEIPTGTYVTEFRNIMNSALAASQPKALPKVATATNPVVTNPNVIKQDIGIKQSPNLNPLQSTATPTLARMEIS